MSDSDAIAQLSAFLQHPDDKVLLQATDICKTLTPDATQCSQLLPTIPDLLRLTSSVNRDIATNAVVALTNMTSHFPAAIDRLIGLNAVTRLMDSVIGAEAVSAHDKLMLLTNLTTVSSGCLQILDLADQDLKGQRLLRLAIKFTKPLEECGIPKAQPHRGLNVITTVEDEYEYAAMVLMNATLMPEGRAIFFATPDFFMPSLLADISSENPIRKQGIIGVVRNLCFDQSQHEFLLKKAKVLRYLVEPFAAKSIEANEAAATLLRTAFPGIVFGDVEPLAVNRHNLLDALLLLAQSDVGKHELIQHSVVVVLRELDDYETDQENKQTGLRIGGLLLGSGRAE
jgi:hypothetical protein